MESCPITRSWRRRKIAEVRMRGVDASITKVIEGGSNLRHHRMVKQGYHLGTIDLDLHLKGLRITLLESRAHILIET